MIDHERNALIPRARAEFRWRCADASPYRVLTMTVLDRAEIDSRRQFDSSSLSWSSGACCAEWLDPACPAETPEGVFAELARKGFHTDNALMETLKEFSKVEGCDWAIQMAAGLLQRLKREWS